MDMKDKKWWVKSKTVISALLIAILSITDIIFDSIHDIITDNIDYLKGALSPKWVSVLLVILAVANIYTRLTATEKLVSKKTIVKEEIKDEVKQEMKEDADSK